MVLHSRQPRLFPRRLLLAFVLSAALGCKTTSRPVHEDSIEGHGSAVVKKASAKSVAFSRVAEDRWIGMQAKKGGNPDRMHVLLAKGDAVGAETVAREVLLRKPMDGSALTVLAASLAINRKFELANHYAEILERHFPDRAETLNIKGLAMLASADGRLSRYYQAAELFQSALTRSPEEIAAALNLGAVQLYLGNAKAATEAFTLAKKRCGGCRDALLGLGNALAVGGSSESAKATYELVLNQDSKDLEVLFRFAVLHHLGFKNRKQAEETLLKIMATAAPNSRDWGRANSYLKAMRLEPGATS